MFYTFKKSIHCAAIPLFHVFFLLAVLKDIIDFLTLLIGAEGTRLLRDLEVTGDPTGAEEAPGPPRGKRVPGAEINSLL
jgi:hypothetical protein